MDLEIDYIEYGLQTAFSVIAMSMLLLVEPGNHVSYIYGLGIPVLFGYTAFISEDSFNKASLASGIVLVYAPISLFMAAMAVVIFICNNFISVFTVSDSFRAHYSSTAIPLIMTGLVIGSAVSGLAYIDPGFESDMESRIIDFGTESTLSSIEAAGLGQPGQKEEMEQLVNVTVRSTESYVLNNYSREVENPDIRVLRQSFDGANNEVLKSLQQGEQSQEEIMRDQVSQMIESTISGRLMFIAIPFSIALLYALQPILGLLTAVSGKIFRTVENNI